MFMQKRHVTHKPPGFWFDIYVSYQIVILEQVLVHLSLEMVKMARFDSVIAQTVWFKDLLDYRTNLGRIRGFGVSISPGYSPAP